MEDDAASRVSPLARVLLVGFVVALFGALVYGVVIALADAPAEPGVAGPGAAPTGDPALAAVASTVGALVAGEEPPDVASAVDGVVSEVGPVYASLRAGGQFVAGDWATETSTSQALVTAVRTARQQADEEGALPSVDAVELCFSHGYRQVELDAGELTDVHTGVLGLELSEPNGGARYSPTLMLAQNWDFDDVLDRAAEDRGVAVEDLPGLGITPRVFACDQVHVTLGDPPAARRMERGNELITLEEVDRDLVQRLTDGMGDWLAGAVHGDGRMTYKYWPSIASESGADNTIRQGMATIALGRLATARDDADLRELHTRNLQYNLDTFYVQDGEFGLIEFEGEVKLGAVALMALAIAEHPDRGRWAQQEGALQRTVEHLWNPDGSFRTFYRPAERDTENQNFYPGEALVYWAELIASGDRPDLLDRFLTSFRYYRQWHLDPANRNPAFVPWHTQAYARVFATTQDRELADFVFEMNDWLLGVQQWDGAPYPDVQGRFYDPERAHFGPPHASSTGVYLEGLIDAYRLATTLGEDDRAAAYLLAIRRGLRSAAQLQFADEVDLYYVTEPQRVLGGIRTTVYDNELRVDNIQHNLLATLEILDTLDADDLSGGA